MSEQKHSAKSASRADRIEANLMFSKLMHREDALKAKASRREIFGHSPALSPEEEQELKDLDEAMKELAPLMGG